jgi:dihydroflavonol-4-reductase
LLRSLPKRLSAEGLHQRPQLSFFIGLAPSPNPASFWVAHGSRSQQAAVTLKVFLTGGTGFIGRPLTRALLSRNWSVTALVRNPQGPQAQAVAALGAGLVAGDITDRESVRAGMLGADVVVHNAGSYEYGVTGERRRLMHETNVSGTDNVLGLALEQGIHRTVYVSSTMYFGGTGPEPRDESYERQRPYHSYYEQTKAEAHLVAQRYQQRGLPLIIVCPNGVVGPNDHSAYGYFLRLYLNHLMPPCAWAPDVIHSHVHVDDVAEGIALAAEKGRLRETYLLAGDPTRQRDLVQTWMMKPGRMKIRFYIPNWLAKVMFAPMEPLQRALGLPAFISRETVSASMNLNYSSTKAQRELGWVHRPAREMWLSIIDQELVLLANRTKRDVVSRLNPVEE